MTNIRCVALWTILVSFVPIHSAAAADGQVKKYIARLDKSSQQELSKKEQQRVHKILKGKGVKCSRIESSLTFPSEGKLGFAVRCPEGKYALHWQDGRTVISE